MKAVVSFSYGATSYTFEFEEAGEKETLLKAIVLGNPPKTCGLIKDPSALYRLEAKEVSGKHIYIEAVCIGKVNNEVRVAKSQLGTYESTKGYFWKTWEIDEFASKRLKESADEAPIALAQTATPASSTTKKTVVKQTAPQVEFVPPTQEEEDDLPF